MWDELFRDGGASVDVVALNDGDGETTVGDIGCGCCGCQGRDEVVAAGWKAPDILGFGR